MDDATRDWVSKARVVIGEAYEWLADLQQQLDEINALQTAMISVLDKRLPGFETELANANSAMLKIVGEENRAGIEQLRRIARDWQSPDSTLH